MVFQPTGLARSRLVLCNRGFAARMIVGLLAGLVMAETWAGVCEVPPALRASGPAGPVVVEARLFVIDVFDVDDVSQTFHADVHADLNWRDDRLSESQLGYSLAGCALALGAVWNPEPRLVNARDYTLRNAMPITVDGDGNVQYAQRFTGILTARLDLREFPFDTQTLPILLAFVGAGENLRIVVADAPPSHDLDFTVSGWKISTIDTVTGLLALTQNLVLPEYRLTMTAERQRGYYLGKVLLPAILIVLMAWGAYWLDPAVQPPRFGLSTSAVLTLIAFKLALGLSLPRVEYLTRADAFMIGAMALVFLTLAQVIVTSVLNEHKRELALRINRTGCWLYPVVFSLIATYTLFF